MKQKDFDRIIDNLIINGLIKEAEQDNADFEAAMRNMSDEEFAEMTGTPAFADDLVCYSNSNMCEQTEISELISYTSFQSPDDIFELNESQLNAMLPKLISLFNNCIERAAARPIFSNELQDAGWKLAMAFLLLRRKIDARKVLSSLTDIFKGTPFGSHCQTMLEMLS